MMKEFHSAYKNSQSNGVKCTQSSIKNTAEKNYGNNNSSHIHPIGFNPSINYRNVDQMKTPM